MLRIEVEEGSDERFIAEVPDPPGLLSDYCEALVAAAPEPTP
jgi:hypothetical protein